MPTTIDEYLAPLPSHQRAELERWRAVINAAVPGAEEAIRTRVPAILYRGKTVVGFGAAKSHVALYVMFGDVLKVLRSELAPFDASNKVVRFTPEEPAPAALIRTVVRLRLAEIDAQMGTASPQHTESTKDQGPASHQSCEGAKAPSITGRRGGPRRRGDRNER